MPITQPSVDADTYLAEDSADIQPKVGTTVQEGWDAVVALEDAKNSEFPTDFRFADEPQLIKFLQDHPFATYEQHWIERPKGKKSVAHSAKFLETRLVESLHSTSLYLSVTPSVYRF